MQPNPKAERWSTESIPRWARFWNTRWHAQKHEEKYTTMYEQIRNSTEKNRKYLEMKCGRTGK